MAITRVARGLATFSLSQVGPPPRSPLGIPPVAPLWSSERAKAEVKSDGALYDWIAAGAGPVFDRQLSYSANMLDPNQIDTIFRQADRGQYLVQYGDLWQLILQRDYQIFTQDRGRRCGIITKQFQITASDPRDEVAIGLRNATEAMVDGIDAFETDGVYSMLSANGPGYALLEVIYEYGTIRFPWRGKTVELTGNHPRQLRYVLPKHLYFGWDTDRPYLNLGSDGNLALDEAPYKWIWYKTLGDGIASMRGFFRPTAWLHLMGQTSMVSGAIFLKLYGIPQIAAYIDQEKWKDPALKATIELALQQNGNGIPTVFPSWMQGKIDMNPGPLAGGGVEVHMKWKGFIDACIAKCVNGSVLSTEASGGGPGSYALGAVHENRSYDVAAVDSVGTCGTIRAQLFRNWIGLNQEAFAKALGIAPEDLLARTPDASRRLDRETTPKERAEIAALFMRNGLETSKRQWRNEYAIDPPDGEEDALKGEPVTVASGGVAVSPAKAGNGVDNPKPEPAPKPAE